MQKSYRKYPLSSVFVYNSLTVIYFCLGSYGIFLGYSIYPIAKVMSLSYLAFAFFEMYILMPLIVCPKCPYHRLKGSRCVSGLNIISSLITRKKETKHFANRSKGILSHNNLYMAGLFLPILIIVPAIFLNFSFGLILILVALICMTLFRIFVVFMKIACVNCLAKNICPNASQMGI